MKSKKLQLWAEQLLEIGNIPPSWFSRWLASALTENPKAMETLVQHQPLLLSIADALQSPLFRIDLLTLAEKHRCKFNDLEYLVECEQGEIPRKPDLIQSMEMSFPGFQALYLPREFRERPDREWIFVETNIPDPLSDDVFSKAADIVSRFQPISMFFLQEAIADVTKKREWRPGSLRLPYISEAYYLCRLLTLSNELQGKRKLYGSSDERCILIEVTDAPHWRKSKNYHGIVNYALNTNADSIGSWLETVKKGFRLVYDPNI